MIPTTGTNPNFCCKFGNADSFATNWPVRCALPTSALPLHSPLRVANRRKFVSLMWSPRQIVHIMCAQLKNGRESDLTLVVNQWFKFLNAWKIYWLLIRLQSCSSWIVWLQRLSIRSMVTQCFHIATKRLWTFFMGRLEEIYIQNSKGLCHQVMRFQSLL